MASPLPKASRALDRLRRFAVARSLFVAPDIERAVATFGFVQADPIRAPARAQDLTLRHRVAGYTAGDLDRRFADAALEEDFFVNYGFLARDVHALMHPRTGPAWPASRRKRADAILAFVRERGAVHPRDVDAHFAHGRVTNYWGGSSNATTHLLGMMHYRGLLRVVRRDAGVRVYGVGQEFAPAATREAVDARLDALVDVVVRKYAPLPAASLSSLVRRLRYAAPQWSGRINGALQRARKRLAHASAGGIDWYWPADEDPAPSEVADDVRLLAPFDPIAWDRRRFELLWDWAYRFEAYTPASKRTLGYYALPLLWQDRIVGWCNVTVSAGTLGVQTGYVGGKAPRSKAFARALEEEVERMRAFLDLGRGEQTEQ